MRAVRYLEDMTATYITEGTYLGRCGNCRKGHRVTITRAESQDSHGNWNARTIAVSNGQPSRMRNGKTYLVCSCGAEFQAKRLDVAAPQYRTKKCDGRCMGAVGPACRFA